ncbi:MAG TPA: hypothetical protein PLN36_01140 [Bacteroidales bacterium]|nr:hypothetical protein [Bacteroidales bacterium]HRT38415.1 hypothetical protein [Rectinema sp.]HRU34019.1 hypothetical protein [Bacteroidales bacterium]
MATERRVKRVYNYKSGLVVMVFEDGKDAILFDPPRLTLWMFEKADDAFKYAVSNKIPMGDSPESISRGVGLPAAEVSSKTGRQSIATMNFIPIESTALILD